MRKLLLLLFLLIPVLLQAQASSNTVLLSNGTPTGSCPDRKLDIDITNNLLYFCSVGTWFASTAGGGTGTVTSIATTSPITGGTITTTGTIACATCAVGPGSSSANHLAIFSGTDGITLADGGAAPAGTVSSFSAGTLSPIFSTSVATATTTPALSFALTNAAAGTVLGNATGSAAGPTYTVTPVLGVDNSIAGTLQLANGSAAAHTIFSSGATTTNTIQGFAAVPTTGHLLDCTVTSTTCLLHDSGVVTANVVNASSPGIGIAHFAGSTQTVTSSAVNLANADVTGVLPLANISQLGVVNAQTTTYQVLAADFTACKTITTASASFTITLVASGSQPASGQCISVINYGSGVVTIARSGQNINGAAANLVLPASGSATTPNGVKITSDGTNYFSQDFGGRVLGVAQTIGSSSSSGTVNILASTPAAGLYRIQFYINQATACSNATTGSVSTAVGFTDATAARSNSNNMVFTTSSASTGPAGTAWVASTLDVWAAASTAITYATTYTACTTGTATYDIHAAVERIQ